MSTLFHPLAVLADQLAGEGSRLKKRAAIADAIGGIASGRGDEHDREGALGDAALFAMYLAGLPFSESDPRKLSAGGALLSKAVLAVSGATGPDLTAAYRRHGDLGAAAYDLLLPRDATKTATVTLAGVAESFDRMATAATTAIRAATVEDLLARATALEAKYLLKLMLGDMRIGVKQSLVEEAVAVAAGAEVTAVRHAVMLEADLAFAVRRAFEGTLAAARMRLFHPLGFMLASPVETPEEAIERFTPKPKKPVVPPQAGKTRARARGRNAGVNPGIGADGGELEGSEMFRDAPELDTISRDSAGAASNRESMELAADEHGDARTAEAAAAAVEQASSAMQALLEDKYDGMRAQLHFADPASPARVALYSRNREDITESFPELVEAFRGAGERTTTAAAAANGVILDGEILGWDVAQDRALPFAVLSPRIGRKRISDEVRRAIPVVFMAFDVMYAEGALQLERPLRERRRLLEEMAETLRGTTLAPLEGPPPPVKAANRRRGKVAVPADSAQTALGFANVASAADVGTLRTTAEASGSPESAAGTTMLPANPGVQRLLLSPARLVETAVEIDQAYADARARANEGVMLKDAGSAYQPGRRGLSWVKLKRELATLDVVITGAEFGSGRRAPFLSDYTFAVRGPGGELLNVGKAYSGVTDQEIVELTEWLKAHTLEDFGHFRTVEPQIILEVAFNNIMRSDRHRSGYALRFPRILRIRTDKPVTEIDTVERVEEVYQSQVDKPAEETGGEQDTASGDATS